VTFDQRAVVWFVVASAGLLAGLASAQPALVAVGAGFLVPLLFGLAARPPRLPEATVRVSADRVIEGARVELELTLAASHACPWLDVELRLPERLDPDGAPTRRVLALHAGETRTLEYSINCPRWGAFRIASIRLSASDQLHLRRAQLVVEPAPEGARARIVNSRGGGYYDDVYVKTPKGWRFKSRNVVSDAELQARLTTQDFIEIRELAGDDHGHYENLYGKSEEDIGLRGSVKDPRFRTSGLRLTPVPNGVHGLAYLRGNGGHYEDLYVKTPQGWRIQERKYVPPAAH